MVTWLNNAASVQDLQVWWRVLRCYCTPVLVACRAFVDACGAIVRNSTLSSVFCYNRTRIHFLLWLQQFWAWLVHDWYAISTWPGLYSGARAMTIALQVIEVWSSEYMLWPIFDRLLYLSIPPFVFLRCWMRNSIYLSVSECIIQLARSLTSCPRIASTLELLPMVILTLLPSAAH